ncbi:BQ5605_C006g04058 [Microbotryum silenes-dioicae]|uniref:BQ5605_C006g04058 protein n=1 Tax=Microbotryum silenes-dioicae TaxID=796604 RepID=A0A2X0MT07_9BASI|nr:BQ5605_C006g04058 [Microbotryum silenes-dioicae]
MRLLAAADRMTETERAKAQGFADWLLGVGDGLASKTEDFIALPHELLLSATTRNRSGLIRHAKKSNTSEIEQSWRPKIRRWIRSTTWCSTCCRVTLKPSTARIRTPSRQAPARNRSTRCRANWFVKSICTGSRHSHRQRVKRLTLYEMDNSNNTDSSTTSRRSEGQQRHRQREKLELERSGPVPHSSLPNPASTALTSTTILLPEELGHNNCGDSRKGSKISLSIDHLHPSQRPKSTLSRWVSTHGHQLHCVHCQEPTLDTT